MPKCLFDTYHAGLRSPRDAKNQGQPPIAAQPIGGVPDFATQVLGLELDSTQSALLASSAKYVILNCCRLYDRAGVPINSCTYQSDSNQPYTVFCAPNFTATPEPGSAWLLGIGALGFGLWRRRS